MPSGWISNTDLATYLTGLGFTAPSGITVADEITAAVDQWEKDTRWDPWDEDASTTLYLTPNDQDTIFLPKPFTAITEVKSGVNVPLSIAGTVLTEGSAWFPLSVIPGDTTKPIYAIRFSSRQSGAVDSISVTGTPGYQATIDQRVWQAVRDLAAALIIEKAQIKAAAALSIAGAGALTEIKQENVTLKFDGSEMAGTAARLRSSYDSAVKVYKRMF